MQKTSKDCLHLLGNFRIDFTFYIKKIRVYFINYSYLKEVLGIVMNFTQSISTCIRKYVTFSGRATRSEFWWFCLFTILVNDATTLKTFFASSTFRIFLHIFKKIFFSFNLPLSLIFFLPSLAVAA